MINDNTGLIFGADQYEAFVNGMWSREPFEIFAIFESLIEPAIHGLPCDGFQWAEFGGQCDKLMIVHLCKFCPPHLQWRKTEYYEIFLGEMYVFYAPEILQDERLRIPEDGLIESHPMPKGNPWPDDIALPKGREHTYELLTEYKKLRPGDPRFVLHRKHLHSFHCPHAARIPVVIREVSGYSHEPTASSKHTLLKDWQHIHDNGFLLEGLAEGRLANDIR